jgi:hypothetical protein
MLPEMSLATSIGLLDEEGMSEGGYIVSMPLRTFGSPTPWVFACLSALESHSFQLAESTA